MFILPPIFSIVSPGEIKLTWLTQLHYWLRLRLTGVVKQAYQEQPPPKLPKQAAWSCLEFVSLIVGICWDFFHGTTQKVYGGAQMWKLRCDVLSWGIHRSFWTGCEELRPGTPVMVRWCWNIISTKPLDASNVRCLTVVFPKRRHVFECLWVFVCFCGFGICYLGENVGKCMQIYPNSWRWRIAIGVPTRPRRCDEGSKAAWRTKS